MKKIVITFIFTLVTLSISAQGLIGAWEANFKANNGVKYKSVLIITKGYQVTTFYNAESGVFHSTNGGTWSLDGNEMTEKVEFDSNTPEKVGLEIHFEIELTKNTFKIVGKEMIWHRIDDGTPDDLFGAWLMSGRKRNGEMQSRDTSRPRKTMKILSGMRFQWIAYNTETKQFMGTGGGSYTTINGKYTENIEFFSRDSTRVGASLEFDYNLKNRDWHHSGFSSKGNPLYEIWSLRK